MKDMGMKEKQLKRIMTPSEINKKVLEAVICESVQKFKSIHSFFLCYLEQWLLIF